MFINVDYRWASGGKFEKAVNELFKQQPKKGIAVFFMHRLTSLATPAKPFGNASTTP